MSELIFHHYESSPFSEKVRLVFGIKGLAWSSVEIPNMLPRPDLMPLTGGYRKTPVMQIGADIYCDTQLILRELERRFPTPTLLPRGNKGIGAMVGFWADRPFFWTTAGMFIGELGPHLPEAFIKDREHFSGGPIDVKAAAAAAPLLRDGLRAHLAILSEQLEDGRPYILGEPISLADINAYMNVWFLRRLPIADALIAPFAKVVAWEARISAIGHGKRQDLSSADALAIGTSAVPQTRARLDADDPNGRKPGDQVAVIPDDSGKVPVVGTIVASDAFAIAIRRQDPVAGDVVVHFPKAGFIIRPV